jgi:hypothetical protein
MEGIFVRFTDRLFGSINMQEFSMNVCSKACNLSLFLSLKGKKKLKNK